MSYKHHIGITSQIPFCSVPLRLDSYSSCQFACAFCFAKSRGGNRPSSPRSSANPDALRARLERVSRGKLQSAVDEFLSMRIPLQFGGMTDPFSPWETTERKTLEILKVLSDFDYPTLISTKGTLIIEPEYLHEIIRGNYYVRISFTGAEQKLANALEAGVPTFQKRLHVAKKLREAGIAVSARLQPIILGHEQASLEILEEFGAVGVQHVSTEYLKWPVENDVHHVRLLQRSMPDMKNQYLELGANLVGREYVLPSKLKFERLKPLKSVAESLGIIFGFAENDLLHLNSFKACCNASDLFLRDANFFQDNILSRVKSQVGEKTLSCPTIRPWKGQKSIMPYLNSRSRNSGSESPEEEWSEFLRIRWNSVNSAYGPTSFLGMKTTGKTDSSGNAIFKNVDS